MSMIQVSPIAIWESKNLLDKNSIMKFNETELFWIWKVYGLRYYILEVLIVQCYPMTNPILKMRQAIVVILMLFSSLEYLSAHQVLGAFL